MVQNGIRFVKNTLNTFPLKSVYMDKSCPRQKSHSRSRSTLSEPGFQPLPYNIWQIVNTTNKNFAALKKPAQEAASQLSQRFTKLTLWLAQARFAVKTSQRSHSLERAQEVKFFPQWSGEGQKYIMSMSSDICNFCLCACGCQKFSDIQQRLVLEPLVSRPRDQETTGSGDKNCSGHSRRDNQSMLKHCCHSQLGQRAQAGLGG